MHFLLLQMCCNDTIENSHPIVCLIKHDMTGEQSGISNLVHDVDVSPSVQQQPCDARMSFRRGTMQCYPTDLKMSTQSWIINFR